MQRGISGKTRRGPPPLPRQRKALRVVQLTLAAVAVLMATFAAGAWGVWSDPPSPVEVLVEGEPPADLTKAVVLSAGALAFAAGALAMGFRTVRGPEPPRPVGPKASE